MDRFEDVGYEFQEMAKFEKYFNRVIVRYPLRRQSKIRLANEVFDDFEVSHLIPINFNLDDFNRFFEHFVLFALDGLQNFERFH